MQRNADSNRRSQVCLPEIWSRAYQAKDGSTRTYRTHLLRRSFRDGGKVKKETLANLSALPDSAIAALKASLSGSVLVDTGDVFEIERSLPHGHVAAAHVMASRLGLGNLLGPDCPERDLAYGLIIARAVAPASKLATTRWWADTTLGADLGISGATADEVYAAMDWLLSRQDAIEKKLAARALIHSSHLSKSSRRNSPTAPAKICPHFHRSR